MELSVNTSFSLSFREKLGDDKMLSMIAQAGFPAAELSLDWLCTPAAANDREGCREYAKRMKAAADKYGLRLGQAQLPFDFNWMMRDTDVLNFVVYPCMERAFEICEYLQIPYAIARPIEHPMTIGLPSRKFTWNISHFGKLADRALPHGVTVCAENMMGTMTVAREMNTLFEQLPDKKLLACVNVGHSNIAGDPPADLIRSISRGRVGTLHISGNQTAYDECMMPGIDQMDWTSILNALADIRYEGDFTLQLSEWAMGALDGKHGFDESFLPAVLEFTYECGTYLMNKLQRLHNEREQEEGGAR